MPIATQPKGMRRDTDRPPGDQYLAGDIIGGKYELGHLIGEGGMGTVWVAQNKTLHKDVALKLVRRELAGSDEAAQRLLNEARATAKLEHPSIVRVHDFGETKCGDPYIVMELLKGESLEDIIHHEETLDPIYAVQMMLPILNALSIAHPKGIVHRDLKPDNILLVESDAGERTPKLVDFGIAKVKYRTIEVDTSASGRYSMHDARKMATRMTQVGHILGSPDFMSPEQARGDMDVDERADLWAISVILYYMISGNLPFSKEDVEDTLMAVLVQQPERIQGCDTELWQILERGMEKSTSDRWPTALEMGEALAGWLLNNGIDADITGRSLTKVWLRDEDGIKVELTHDEDTAAAQPLTVATESPRSSRISAGALFGVVGLIAIAGGVGFMLMKRQPPPPPAAATAVAAQPTAEATVAPTVEPVETAEPVADGTPTPEGSSATPPADVPSEPVAETPPKAAPRKYTYRPRPKKKSPPKPKTPAKNADGSMPLPGGVNF
jgi:serine/threonine protein kinase